MIVFLSEVADYCKQSGACRFAAGGGWRRHFGRLLLLLEPNDRIGSAFDPLCLSLQEVMKYTIKPKACATLLECTGTLTNQQLKNSKNIRAVAVSFIPAIHSAHESLPFFCVIEGRCFLSLALHQYESMFVLLSPMLHAIGH